VGTKVQVLIVDDTDYSLETMQMMLKEQFDVTTVMDGYKALDTISGKDFEVAIVDLVMPNISGLETLRRMKEIKPSTEVIMVTGYGSVDTTRQTMKSGAFDYIEKPFNQEQIQRIIYEAIEHRQKKILDEKERDKLLEKVHILEQETKRLRENNYQDMVELLSQVIDIQQNYTMQHLKSVAEYIPPIADKLQLSEEEKEDLQIAAALHDIGKLAIDESILNKTTPLTDSDWMQLKSHPVAGARIVGTVDGWEEAAEGIRHHHEWLNGTGYPDGLEGDNIPLISRIVFVADAFDAMTSDRAYRKAMDKSEAIGILKEYSGRQFDPAVVEAFVDMVI